MQINAQKTISISIVSVTLVAAVLAGFWYFAASEPSTDNKSAQPGNVVAMVNGEEIPRSELELSKSRFSASQGVDIDSLDDETRGELETQLVNDLVSRTLLEQTVNASGITTSQEDVDEQIAATISQFGGDEAFQSALAAEGLSEEELRARISTGLATQTYLEQELGFAAITVTDEEIEASYNEVADQNDNVPPLDEVRPQVEQSLIQQKQQSLVAQFIERLRLEANIEILL